MTESALQRAIAALAIRDVFITRSESWLCDDFDPRYSPEAERLAVAWKHRPVESRVVSLELDNGEKLLLFRVIIEVGARFITDTLEHAEQETGRADASEPQPECARIEARFVAEYEMHEPLDDETRRAFALHNASYHIWPYWREYLMSQCVRMNLPKVALPTRQFARSEQPGSQPAGDTPT